MKKWITVLMLIMVTQATIAQDFKKVQTLVVLNNFEAAKAEYDKVVTKKPALSSTVEAYYWKAKIFGGYVKTPDLAAKNPDAYNQQLTAFNAYMEADTAFKLAEEFGKEPFFEVYLKNLKDGVAAFGEKNWNEASKQFEVAVKLSDIIYGKGWSNSKQTFDTTTLLYAGYSNQNANNVDQAIKYYGRLINAKLNTPEYVDMYRYILIKFIERKDQQNFDSYYAIAEASYPNEQWFEYRADYIDKNLTLEEKLSLYDQQVAKGAITEFESQMYGDIFMSSKNDENLAKEKMDLFIEKAADAYKRAYNMNPTNYAAAFNAGISYYNQYGSFEELYSENIKNLQALNAGKPAAPKDPKKKLAFEASFKAQQDSIKKLNVALDVEMKVKVDFAIEWIENAFRLLKDKEKLEKQEKNVAGRSVDFLANLYIYKRDKVRGKDQKLFDEYEAKFNVYDQLHDKYQ